MDNKENPIVSKQFFPSNILSDEEKQSNEFGLKIGQAIQYEWFKQDGGSCAYYNRWDQFHKARLYARGEQGVQKYKNELAINGDLSYLNLDWTPVPIIPKFVDIVVNGMSERLFSVKAVSQDALSAEKRNNFQDAIEADMVSRGVLDQVSQDFGVDPFSTNQEDLPESDQELELYMQLNYKPAIEIAEEQAISTIFAENHWQDTQPRMNYDLATLGMAVAKHEFLPGFGIKVSYADPANIIHSYTDDPCFKDCFYWGEVKQVPITEIYKIDPDISSEKIKEITLAGSKWFSHFNLGGNQFDSSFQDDTCTLLYFNYKTTKKTVYKKKKLSNGGERVIEKDESFNPPQEMMDEGNFERIERIIDVWYNGVLVAGTSILIEWEMAKNMVRPKSASQFSMPNYVASAPRMYKGSIDSLVKRMIPFNDLIQITHLKIQQIMAKMVPDGVFIDADGISEVDLGNGGSYTPEDALRLYFQTGSVIGRSSNGDGDFNNARVPIQELIKSSGQSKLQALISNYNHYLDMIRQVTGLNEARDGSTPDPRALVGVQKLAALNSNTATRHMLDASLYIFRTIAECLSTRISDLLEYADFAEEFANQIGKYNKNILDEIKELYMFDFGIFIEISPDEEEKMSLEGNIQAALAKENINLEDAIDVRGIKNIKIANELLKVKRKKKQENDQKAAMMSQQMQAQMNMQSQQAAAQASMQKTQMETEAKIRIEQAKGQNQIMVLREEALLKSNLMEKEFLFNMQLRGSETEARLGAESMKEDRKDKRVDKQSTQQSKMISQRKDNTPPVDFESTEDTLDGFGFDDIRIG